MKILHMLQFPLRGTGAGTYVDALARALLRRGHQVMVLCSDHTPQKQEYPVEAVLFNNGMNDKFDLDFDFPVFVSHPLSKGPQFGQLSAQQLTAYLSVFRAKIEQSISLFAPDIIHVHHGWIIASIVAEYKVPYVISLHGTELYAFQQFPAYQKLVLRGFRGAQVIIALTEEERNRAINEYNIKRSKVVVIRSGVDCSIFKPIEVDKVSLLTRYSIQDTNKPIVFFGGRLIQQKGVEILIEAARIYSQAKERPITIIAGNGELMESLVEKARKLGIGSIYFLGLLSQQQMVEFYNVANVVVVPSIIEPFGLVAAEALACGTPVVASNIGGLKEIVNEQVGYLITPGDHKTLAKKVTSFIRNDFKEKSKAFAVNYIKDNFNIETTAGDIEKLYGSIRL